jgi:hypothetical protein
MMPSQPKNISPVDETPAMTPTQPADSPAGAELLRMLDGLSDACLVADVEGRVHYANEAARELLHLRGRVAGRKLPAVLSDRQALHVISEAGRTARSRSVVIPLTLSSDGARNYTVCVMPVQIPGSGLLLRIALRRGENAGAGSDPLHSATSPDMIQRLGDPLTIIQGYLENLLDGVIQDPVVMRQCLSAMRRQTVQIQRILGSAGK